LIQIANRLGFLFTLNQNHEGPLFDVSLDAQSQNFEFFLEKTYFELFDIDNI
jgi:hypothetical protein